MLRCLYPAYDWKSVPERGVIVDVGCGLGHVSLDIASVRPDLRFILEDRAVVLQDTDKVCNINCNVSS